jgi:hypothetical protein
MTAGGDLLLPPIARVRNGSPHRHRSADAAHVCHCSHSADSRRIAELP